MTGASVSWQSSAPNVAQVNSSSGLVTALATGSATITATSGTATGQGSVTVQQEISAVTVQAGDGQTGYLNEALPVNPSVKVTDSGGSRIPGVQVSFEVIDGGGGVASSTATTDTDGIASTTWTLGSVEGTQTLRATAGSVHADFTATGEKRPAKYAVLVYMAADNSLSVPGILDIDEMESVGSTDEVVTLVQAEFSPEQMSLYNCTPACFNRPNYNTFRYEVQAGSTVNGPDGTAEDIGNRDMTDPAELADFISWATTNYPAENYVLVLWNHGGGYLGLLEDQTSASGLMSLQELRAGLAAAGTQFSIIDFDMCLMGGLETAVSVSGYADYLVFSEETEPGDGNPYDTMLQELVSDPNQSPGEAAQMFVNTFVASYEGTKNSATKSAFDMSRLSTVVDAWDALGSELANNLATHQGAIAAGADLDLWVLEPNGDLFIPFLGVVTPNGVLSGDSYDTGTFFEYYRTRRYVERGEYYFLGNLWTDLQDYRPLADVAFRFGSDVDWTWLHEGSLLTFSTQVSWLDDDEWSFQRTLNGNYTDLQWVAYWDIRSTSVEAYSSDPDMDTSLREGTRTDRLRAPSLTSAQFEFLSRLREDPRLQAMRDANRREAERSQGVDSINPLRIPALKVEGRRKR